uniref:Ig-like domain-containing protein n=1 Tax=Oryzias melastigma TaxID=30732 RepID=A0A3B3E075_ORYME
LFVTQKPSWSQMFRGETITLTCEVQGGEGVQWEYEWRTPQSQTFRTNRKDWTFTASISGDYSCKSRPTDDSYSGTKWSEAVRVSVSDKPKAHVTQKPSWSQMFRGETITLTCEVQGGEGVQWEYEWRTPQSQTFRTNRKDWTFTASISGDYSCKSRPTDDSYSGTKWSQAVKLTVSDVKPEPVLRVSPRWLSPGSSVTLNHLSLFLTPSYSTLINRVRPSVRTIKVWPAETDSVLQDRFQHTDWSMFASQATCGSHLDIDNYASSVMDYITNTIDDAELTIEPKWSTFYNGESVTFKCDMKEGRAEDWTYTLNRSDWTVSSNDPRQHLLFNRLDKHHVGVYQCCGHRKSSDSTTCSNRVSI